MDDVIFGYSRLAKPWQTKVRGWRFMVPVAFAWRDAYDVCSHDVRVGRWFFVLNLIVRPDQEGRWRPKIVGGWVPSRSAQRRWWPR